MSFTLQKTAFWLVYGKRLVRAKLEEGRLMNRTSQHARREVRRAEENGEKEQI